VLYVEEHHALLIHAVDAAAAAAGLVLGLPMACSRISMAERSCDRREHKRLAAPNTPPLT
jgi:hypothetical protein